MATLARSSPLPAPARPARTRSQPETLLEGRPRGDKAEHRVTWVLDFVSDPMVSETVFRGGKPHLNVKRCGYVCRVCVQFTR